MAQSLALQLSRFWVRTFFLSDWSLHGDCMQCAINNLSGWSSSRNRRPTAQICLSNGICVQWLQNGLHQKNSSRQNVTGFSKLSAGCRKMASRNFRSPANWSSELSQYRWRFVSSVSSLDYSGQQTDLIYKTFSVRCVLCFGRLSLLFEARLGVESAPNWCPQISAEASRSQLVSSAHACLVLLGCE